MHELDVGRVWIGQCVRGVGGGDVVVGGHRLGRDRRFMFFCVMVLAKSIRKAGNPSKTALIHG